jgi:hypothetical protein
MLPDAHDRPSRLHQLRVIAPVSIDVSVELCLPVVTVGLRSCAVLRAAMPKTAVNEHRDSLPHKHDIRTAPDTRGCRDRLTKSISAAVKLGTKS